MNRLTIAKGPQAGEVLDLSGGLTIGRDAAAAAAAFDDSQLSSVHCRIAPLKGGGFGIQDLGSASGTFVNGKRVGSARLAHGDRIAVGSLELVFETSGGAAALPAAPHSAPPHSATPHPAAEPARPEPPPKAHESALLGKTLGGYLVESVLGRGGMGTVYRAQQTSLHRTVALKVLSPELAGDPKFVELFLKEARAAAQLHHPNVVTIFDVGSSGQTHYYSMELFEGGSVEQFLKRERKLPVPRALAIARDAARALEFAESRGIVHRDLKPDNLMITAQGTAKLADLGLAGHLGESEAARFGTPHFLAPECIRGAVGDHKSDLYSLGATLFRMITGSTPFQGTTVAEILAAAQSTGAPALRSLDPSVSEAVDSLVSRLLHKDPARRPPSAREVAGALERLLAPSAKRGASPALLAAGAVAVLAGAAGIYFALRRGEPQQSKPVVVRDRAEEDRLRQEREASARALRATEAELALAKIPEALPFAERVARLEAIARDFAETPAAAKATTEIASARASEETRQKREEAKREAIASYRSNLERKIQSELASGQFARALVAPKETEGFESAVEDPDAKAAIDVVPERVSAAVETQAKETLDKALGQRSAGRLDEAEATYRALAASLKALLELPAESVGEARGARFRTLLTSVEGALAEIARGKADWTARAEAEARASAREALRSALDSLRAGRPEAAAAALEAASAWAKSEGVRSVLAELVLDAKASAQVLARLFEASSRQDLGSEPFPDPATGKPCHLVAVDAAGIHLEPKGSAIQRIPFEKLASGAATAALLQRAGVKSASDAVALARATLAATLAHEVARLAQYQRSLRLDGSALPAPPDLPEEGFQAALDALGSAGDGSDPGAVAALRARIEGERAGARQLREGLAAFATGRYADAERALAAALRAASGTALDLLCCDGASKPESAPAPR